MKTPGSGEEHARLGLEHFRREEYDFAARCFESALKASPDRDDWRELHALAAANATAEAHLKVPGPARFEAERLLAPATAEALPDPGPPARPSLLTRLRRPLQNGFGALVTMLFDGLTTLLGKTMGYRGALWTNWYRRPLPLGILTLAYMRERLNKRNLRSAYPAGALVGFQPPDQAPPPGVERFRTADGSWNNLADPKEGAAGTRFPRNARVRPTHGHLLDPNPREVSRRLLTRHDENCTVPFLNLLAASWIQFQNHDWISHGESSGDDAYEIPLVADDPIRLKFGQDALYVPRTPPDPTRRDGDPPATHLNEVTHWWDGSQIYGSDVDTQRRLRSGIGGKLRVDDDGRLPLDDHGIERTGFVRNWWVGLSLLHTLFVKEHNTICDHLAARYPDFDDDRLFQVARLVNAALMAKIHTIEWTPAILPNRGLDVALNANWYGIFTNMLRQGKNRRTVAEIKVRNAEMGGVVGNPRRNYGAPFGLTEEFVEVYRLHSLLPEHLELRSRAGAEETGRVHLPATRMAGSAKLTERVPMADLLLSFGTQHPGQLVLNNYPRFLQELAVPGVPVLDLGTVDIVRARERGVPRYNEFREELGLKPIGSFTDLTDDAGQIAALTELYGEGPAGVNKLDLMIGTLAEAIDRRPAGFGFGETMFQIFILNATRRLQTDRFYTDDYNELTYTPEGLKWIDDNDLKSVLLRHHPELNETGLANIKNAFEPWDDAEQLDPQRHPLRAHDKELKPDPWRGDRYR